MKINKKQLSLSTFPDLIENNNFGYSSPPQQTFERFNKLQTENIEQKQTNTFHSPRNVQIKTADFQKFMTIPSKYQANSNILSPRKISAPSLHQKATQNLFCSPNQTKQVPDQIKKDQRNTNDSPIIKLQIVQRNNENVTNKNKQNQQKQQQNSLETSKENNQSHQKKNLRINQNEIKIEKQIKIKFEEQVVQFSWKINFFFIRKNKISLIRKVNVIKDFVYKNTQVQENIVVYSVQCIYDNQQYQLRHLFTGSRVALKVIKKEVFKDEYFLFQFLWEVKIQYCIKHPNIVQLYTLLKTGKAINHDNIDSEIVLVLEVCPDGDLFSYLRKQPNGKLNESEASQFIEQICLALKFLHQHEVIHRDIKPENILLSFGQAKLADFTFCIYTPGEDRKTQCGTLVYQSPEVIKGDLYNKQSDLWSIGVLAYELCNGGTPWCGLSREQAKEKIKNAQFDYPEKFSEDLKDFIKKLTRPNPKERMSCQVALQHPWIKKNKNLQEKLSINEIQKLF